jgi:hypothetical protein
MAKPYLVNADWDSQAKVWVASSNDVPGLVTEALSLEALDAKLKIMVPELLELNDCLPQGSAIDIEIMARRFSVANIAHA